MKTFPLRTDPAIYGSAWALWPEIVYRLSVRVVLGQHMTLSYRSHLKVILTPDRHMIPRAAQPLRTIRDENR